MAAEIKCYYCDNNSVSQMAGSKDICANEICRRKYSLEPYNDAVTIAFRNNPLEVIFMIRISWAAALSPRRDMIFNPFPWSFRTCPPEERYGDDILGEKAPPNRDYVTLEKVIHLMPIEDLFALIDTSANDTELISRLNELHNPQSDATTSISTLLYTLVKFIIETKTIRAEYSEWEINRSLTNAPHAKKSLVLEQYKIKHDSDKEAAFSSANEFCYLFHGSAIENWHSIIRNGIINCSNSKLMTAGAAYGEGIYLSDNLDISSHYSRGNINNLKYQYHGSDMIVAVFQVAGNKQQYEKNTHIYVVPDSTQLLLRYLIVVPRGTNLSKLSQELENVYGKVHKRDSRIAEKIHSKTSARIEMELKRCADYLPTGPIYHFTINHKLTIAVKFTPKYPFEPPLMWVIKPMIISPVVLPTGAIALPQLTRSNWRPTVTLVSLFEKISAAIGPVIDIISQEEYNQAEAIRSAQLIA